MFSRVLFTLFFGSEFFFGQLLMLFLIKVYQQSKGESSNQSALTADSPAFSSASATAGTTIR